MTGEMYKRTVLEVVKYSSYAEKDELLGLLRETTFIFEKNPSFSRTGVWNQRIEYLNLYIQPKHVEKLKVTHRKYLEDVCFQTYVTNDEYMLKQIFIYPGSISDDITTQEVSFKENQKVIIDEIRQARYSIWAAVAWFTDPTIFSELKKQKKRGVNVRIIIDDNEINNKAPFILESEFETYRLQILSKYKNIMHHKFCMIDLKTVIEGSFNWTTAAQYNKETLNVIHGREIAESYADQFLDLLVNEVGGL